MSLEAITYVVSRGDHVRRCSGRLRMSSLASNSHLKTWLRDAGYMCNVCAQRVVKGFFMAAILPFAFEVGCECFFGQARMHLCVHLHGCTYVYTCTHVHVHVYIGTGMGASMYTYNMLLTVLAWRPFYFLPFNCFSISSIRFLYWISFEGGRNQIFNLVGLPHC